MNRSVETSNFEEIRRENCYFADKYGLKEEFLKTQGAKVTRIARPGRFGGGIGARM
ncbi:MAG: hypothetical protein HFE84_01095 [Lachnospiraceae bacterium]|nr:hypothetical protein [Lachnospiraceae bacterium]